MKTIYSVLSEITFLESNYLKIVKEFSNDNIILIRIYKKDDTYVGVTFVKEESLMLPFEFEVLKSNRIKIHHTVSLSSMICLQVELLLTNYLISQLSEENRNTHTI